MQRLNKEPASSGTSLLFVKPMQTEDVTRLNQYQLVISIPKKRGKSGTVNYMSPEGIKLILEQPDAKRYSGRRDMVLLSLMYDSGARVQEIADISVGDFRGGATGDDQDYWQGR